MPMYPRYTHTADVSRGLSLLEHCLVSFWLIQGWPRQHSHSKSLQYIWYWLIDDRSTVILPGPQAWLKAKYWFSHLANKSCMPAPQSQERKGLVSCMPTRVCGLFPRSQECAPIRSLHGISDLMGAVPMAACLLTNQILDLQFTGLSSVHTLTNQVLDLGSISIMHLSKYRPPAGKHWD